MPAHTRLQEAGVFTCLEGGTEKVGPRKVMEQRKRKKKITAVGRKPDLRQGEKRWMSSQGRNKRGGGMSKRYKAVA